ncbi:hypothetical protein, partial [Cardiobacterium valvarum]
HPRPDLANICGPAESAARQLGSSTVRQFDSSTVRQLDSSAGWAAPAAKEVMEDAVAQLSKTSLP